MLADIATLFPDAAIEPTHDRRLTQRFVALWTQAGRGAYPSWDAFRMTDLGADWNWLFTVDLKRSQGFPHFIFLGSRLARLSDVHLAGDENWTMSLLDRATAEIGATVAAGSPLLRESELTLFDGRKVQFRCVSAPLSDDGVTITHVCGVASGRLIG